MRIPKRYGESKVEKCPFCERQATAENREGVPVCESHKSHSLDGLKCLICKKPLVILTGKYGAYAKCVTCGNVNLKRILELNPVERRAQQSQQQSQQQPSQERTQTTRSREQAWKPTEVTIRSDELDD